MSHMFTQRTPSFVIWFFYIRDLGAWTATKSDALNKQFMLSTAQLIAEKVVSVKAKHQDRVLYGFLKKLLQDGKEIFLNF